jgi:hypothetical protein
MLKLVTTINHNATQVYDSAVSDAELAMRRVIDLKLSAGASFAEREVAILELANDICRVNLEQDLKDIAESQAAELTIDGILYKQHCKGSAIYHSLCGPLNINRPTYRKVGQRNGRTVVPLELEAGMSERATPALAYSIALSSANNTSRLYVEEMGAAHRKVASRSKVARIAKAIGARAKKSASRIERHIRRAEEVPDGAVAVSIGLDRTTVPFEELLEKNESPKNRHKKRSIPYVRQPPAPVEVNYRMAYVGTVSIIDADGESMVTRKYCATHEDGPEAIVLRMMADVRAAKIGRPKLALGIVQDGAAEMWNLMCAAMDEEASVDKYHQAIDRYHLNERLGNVLKVTEANSARRAERISRWNHELDTDDRTIERIERYISQRRSRYRGHDLEILQDNLTYIRNNGNRMCYVSLRQAGLPIGSGATEGACKSVVAVRAKRSGQRWHNEGVSAVLTLRAIHQSNRLPRFWSHLSQEYIRQIENVAA